MSKLMEPLPYVVAELVALRPAIVLLPRAVWRQPVFSAAMRGASPRTRFLPMPQFDATVVNCHLGKYEEAAIALRRVSTGTPLAEWMGNLDGFNKENAWRFIAALDSSAVLFAPGQV